MPYAYTSPIYQVYSKTMADGVQTARMTICTVSLRMHLKPTAAGTPCWTTFLPALKVKIVGAAERAPLAGTSVQRMRWRV